MTHTELDTLQNKLAGMPPEALAAFIAELAVTSDRVREAVDLFVERENPSRLTSALRKQLRVFERNEHFYHYREAQTLVRRLDDWLDRIKQDLLPQNPEAVIELLKALAGRIEHWGDRPSHRDWWATFMEQHRRKSALVDKLRKADIDLP